MEVRRLATGNVDDHLAAMWRVPVFHQVDGLPCSQGQHSVHDRNEQRRAGERRPNMGRHVVRTLAIVRVDGVPRREPVEPGQEVSDADVCRHRRAATPAAIPVSATKAASGAVMSIMLGPAVSTRSRPEA